MDRGWFIGDFYPSVKKTKEFEVGILIRKKGEAQQEHHHKIATEYNVLIEGSMTVNDIHIEVGDIFIIEPNESTISVILEDCKILCVKTPSVIGDKYETVRE